MAPRSEQLADHIAERLEFITFLACSSALLALLCGMNGQQALAFTALNLPFGLAILLGSALLAPLAPHWRLPLMAALLLACALASLNLGGEWLEPIALWGLYGLLGLELLWQARHHKPAIRADEGQQLR
jgi:hypothetical protein